MLTTIPRRTTHLLSGSLHFRSGTVDIVAFDRGLLAAPHLNGLPGGQSVGSEINRHGLEEVGLKVSRSREAEWKLWAAGGSGRDGLLSVPYPVTIALLQLLLLVIFIDRAISVVAELSG